MVIIFIVMIYYLKTRFVKGFPRILGMYFCSFIAQSNRNFLSDSSMDVKKRVHTWQHPSRRAVLPGVRCEIIILRPAAGWRQGGVFAHVKFAAKVVVVILPL